MNRKTSLMSKSLTQFAVCLAALLLLATPLFYLLTRNYYAEDMADLVEAVRQGSPLPATDLEADILQGLVLQFVLTVSVVGVAMLLTMRIISRRLWKPFDRTLAAMEAFRLEEGHVPQLPDSSTREFARLNDVVSALMRESVDSYRVQREFTENASHELQTPLAVFQGKLDILLQQPGLTEEQAAIIQDLYRMTGRLSRLSRNLLLLAKMEDNQFGKAEETDMAALIKGLTPYFESLSGGLQPDMSIIVESLPLHANRTLAESMVSNLLVNAVRYNRPGGTVSVTLTADSLEVSNTSDVPPLDPARIFNRFYRPTAKTSGNGLGLAIVKAVCEYHGWTIAYSCPDGRHTFTVRFC